MTEAVHLTNQQTSGKIGDLLQAVHNTDRLGINLHIMRLKKIPNSFGVKDIDTTKWELWRDQLEQRFQWRQEDRIEREGDGRFKGDEYSYCLHLQNGIPVYRDQFDESVVLYYDHLSDQKTVQMLKAEVQELKKESTNFEIGFALVPQQIVGTRL